ncbi:hypothetical protein KR032_004027, partial [Drosophila birchii]
FQSMQDYKRLWLFATMQLSLMLSMIDVVIKIEISLPHKRPLALPHLEYKLSDLAYSPLLSVCAMSTMFYGYGLVYLRVDGCLDSFLSRIRRASLSVWDRCSLLMFLPWLLGVGEGLFRIPFYQVVNPYGFLGINYTMLTLMALYFWYCVLFLALGSFFLAIQVNRQLRRSRHIRITEPEMYDYAQRINELNGFEIICLNT